MDGEVGKRKDERKDRKRTNQLADFKMYPEDE